MRSTSIISITIEEVCLHANARSTPPRRCYPTPMFGATRPDGYRGFRGLGRDPSGALGFDQRKGRRVGRDGDPVIEGVRIQPGDLARHANGLRFAASPRTNENPTSPQLKGRLSPG